MRFACSRPISRLRNLIRTGIPAAGMPPFDLPDEALDGGLWSRRAMVGTGLAGMFWGSSALVLFPGDLPHQVAIAFVLAIDSEPLAFQKLAQQRAKLRVIVDQEEVHG